MLLRESGKQDHGGVDLHTVTGQGDQGSVPHGDLLVAFAELAHAGGEGLAQVIERARGELGEAGFVEAAGTIAIFNGLVRTADASGIPLDEGTFSVTVSERATLGLDDYASADNTEIETVRTDIDAANVAEVFR